MSANGVALIFGNRKEFVSFGELGLRQGDLEVGDNLTALLGALVVLHGSRGLTSVVPVRIDFQPSFGERQRPLLLEEALRQAKEQAVRATDPLEAEASRALVRFLEPQGWKSREEMAAALAESFRARGAVLRRAGRGSEADQAERMARAAEWDGRRAP